MARTMKICTIQPEGGRVGARPRAGGDEVAAAERVDNVRVMPLRRAASRPAACRRRAAQAVGERAHGCASASSTAPSVQEKVAAIAKEWEAVANLTLRLRHRGAVEIRVSFAEEGFSWSTVGTDALTVPRARGDDELRLARAGHRDPGVPARRAPRVRPRPRHDPRAPEPRRPRQDPVGQAQGLRLLRPAGLVDARTSTPTSSTSTTRTSTNFTTFDPTSIMQYAVPDSLTIGTYLDRLEHRAVGPGRVVHAGQYPATAPATVELDVGGDRHVAAVACVGEVDTYHFDVRQAATHIMTTEGATDTVLTLHGPGDPGTVMAWDDDRGDGAQRPHRAQAAPGAYWLSVRHRNRRHRDLHIGVKAAEPESGPRSHVPWPARWDCSAEPRTPPRSSG